MMYRSFYVTLHALRRQFLRRRVLSRSPLETRRRLFIEQSERHGGPRAMYRGQDIKSAQRTVVEAQLPLTLQRHCQQAAQQDAQRSTVTHKYNGTFLLMDKLHKRLLYAPHQVRQRFTARWGKVYRIAKELRLASMMLLDLPISQSFPIAKGELAPDRRYVDL